MKLVTMNARIALLCASLILLIGLASSFPSFASTATQIQDPFPTPGAAVTISNVQVSISETGATIAWSTDRTVSGAVRYGAVGSDVALQPSERAENGLDHLVTLTDLRPGTRYTYRIVVVDASLSSTFGPDSSFTTLGTAAPQLNNAPTPEPQAIGPSAASDITFWYSNQSFGGSGGTQQRWINILGHVESPLIYNPSGVITDTTLIWPLEYSLNGSGWYRLGFGRGGAQQANGEFRRGHPTGRRLYRENDFNIEIDRLGVLSPAPIVGTNTVTVRVRDSSGTVLKTASTTFQYTTPTPLRQPYTIDWSSLSSIYQAGVPVDGKWEIKDGQLHIAEVGYDRVVAIGDTSWDYYEVTVPITINAINEPDDATYGSGFESPSNGPGIGIVLRWQGHTAMDASQPTWGYSTVGAIGWYNWKNDTNSNVRENYAPELNIYYGSAPLARDTSGKTLTFGTTYIYKVRVEPSATRPTGVYKFKVWQQGTAEPADWDLTVNGHSGGLLNGSVLLLAHQVDASFGNVTITPIPRILLPMINKP